MVRALMPKRPSWGPSQLKAERHLTFEELFKALTELTALIEDFQNCMGNWVVDAEIRLEGRK
jgi:hypothetical protein